MWYTIIPVLCLVATSFVYSDSYLYMKEDLVTKYNKWRNLNMEIASRERNNVKVLLISTKLILNTFYIAFLQYINTSIRKLDRKTYEVSYVIEGKLYKMIVIPKRGPAPVLQIFDENYNDITQYVLPYMGPQYDWHGKKFTPLFFGHNCLTFELGDGTEYTYMNDSEVDYTD